MLFKKKKKLKIMGPFGLVYKFHLGQAIEPHVGVGQKKGVFRTPHLLTFLYPSTQDNFFCIITDTSGEAKATISY